MAKIYGQLEKAQLENTTSDTASHPKGMITYRTDLNQAKVSNGTSYKLLIDEDSSQTLSNKTYASPSITGALTAAQTTTPANPSSGSNKLYFKADGKLYTLDSAGNEALVGSGTGGAKNLITNGNADDTSASIFTAYADAAATRPVDGTGGSPTVTTSVSSSSPLDGVKSFLLTKPASNVQGQGWSVPFTVDPAYRAKSLKISVDYIINSGTFVAGGSSTDSDVIWYIYDVTNSQLIEPSNIKMFSNNSSISDKFEATFQSSATGSSYRLIAHVQSVSALAYELKVDNITVSPQSYVFGSPISDWVDYTPSFLNLTLGNGTVRFAYRREGDSIEIKGAIIFGTTTALTGQFQFSLPAGLSLDITKSIGSQNGRGIYNYEGVATAYLGSGVREHYSIIQANTSLTSFYIEGTRNDGVIGTFSNTFPAAWANGYELHVTNFKVPIAGWSSSVQMSDSADTRVVACSYVRTTTQSVAPVTDTTVVYDSKRHDTHAAMNTSNGRFYAPVSGYYRISASVFWTTFTPSAGQFLQMHFRKRDAAGTSIEAAYKDSYTVNTAVSQEIALRADSTFYCNAGESLEVELYHNTGVSRTTVAGINHVDIERVTGPSAIAASESVSISYYDNNTGASTSGQPVFKPGVKVWDSHGAFNTATGEFTAPISGEYQISAEIILTGASRSAGAALFLCVEIDGLLASRKFIAHHRLSAALTGTLEAVGTGRVKLLAGQKLTLRIFDDSNTSLFTAASPVGALNYLNISRVGNY